MKQLLARSSQSPLSVTWFGELSDHKKHVANNLNHCPIMVVCFSPGVQGMIRRHIWQAFRVTPEYLSPAWQARSAPNGTDIDGRACL